MASPIRSLTPTAMALPATYPVLCPVCDGTGFEEGDYGYPGARVVRAQCSHCEGHGRLTIRAGEHDDGIVWAWIVELRMLASFGYAEDSKTAAAVLAADWTALYPFSAQSIEDRRILSSLGLTIADVQP